MRNTLPLRVRLGIFEVDLRAGELRDGDRIACLREQSLSVLRILVEHAGEIVTRDELKQKLWPNDTIVDFDHGINAAIRRLRQALGDSAEEPKYIETIARRGYRLLATVELIAELPSSDDGGGGDPATLATNAASLIGKKVSHYRVLEVLGGGGMGMLYKAEDLKLGRQVALKFLPEELVWDMVALQRFEREAQTASSLDHPNICTIYEVEEHEHQPFIVMQLLKGETLRDRLATLAAEQKKLPLEELLEIATQICEGLQAAHAKGIIHRDVKPANIFLTTTGQVKILDFGLAKLVSTAHETESVGLQPEPGGTGAAPRRARSLPLDATLTDLGIAMGTVGYMSPEQSRGEKLDARTDIFSFGLVLYEMATGQRAFTGDSALTIQDAILRQTPVPARQRNASIPPKLQAVIDRAIQKDRNLRYQHTSDMQQDLAQVQRDLSSRTVALRPLDGRAAEAGERLPHSMPLGTEKLRFVHSATPGRVLIAALLVTICVVTVIGVLHWRTDKIAEFHDGDTLVLADIDNRTGDPIFDDSLKEVVSLQLSQSPFINVLSNRKLRRALKEISHSAIDPLTENLALEVCRRAGSKAVISGSIRASGKEYTVGLRAVDCNTRKVLAKAEEQARDRGDRAPDLR